MFAAIPLVLLCITAQYNSATVVRRNVNHNLASANNENEVTTTEEIDICTSEMCAKESQIMLSSLDESVNPCENFYEFACGNYIRKTTLPTDKSVELSFFQVQEKVEEQLKNILTEELQPNELHPLKLAKDFTKICMDEALLNEQGKNR